jgi:hypothetical protein
MVRPGLVAGSYERTNRAARGRELTSIGSGSSSSSFFLASRRLCSFLTLRLGMYRVNTRAQVLELVPCMEAVARIDAL